jgi:hypothetical protein
MMLVPRLIESVLLADVLFDCGRNSLLAGIEVTGSEFDQAPGDCDHNEDSRDRNQETSDYEAQHF